MVVPTVAAMTASRRARPSSRGGGSCSAIRYSLTPEERVLYRYGTALPPHRLSLGEATVRRGGGRRTNGEGSGPSPRHAAPPTADTGRVAATDAHWQDKSARA